MNKTKKNCDTCLWCGMWDKNNVMRCGYFGFQDKHPIGKNIVTGVISRPVWNPKEGWSFVEITNCLHWSPE